MSQLFISHSTKDREWVERELLGLVSALSLDAWFAEDDIESAEQWERSILSGLKASSMFVLVMSENSAGSEWVRDELNWAMSNREGSILPLMIDGCSPTDFHLRLPRVQYIDFTVDRDKAKEELIAKLVRQQYVEQSDSDRYFPGIEAIIRASDLPMYFTDTNSIIRFANKRLSTLLGMKENELVGKPVRVLVDRFVSLAPDHRKAELRKKQDFFRDHGMPDHAEEDDLLDLRHLKGSRYEGIQRVWISGDRVYARNSETPVGQFFIYRPQLVDN